MSASIADAPWFSGADLPTLLSVLSEGGEEARIAGGAVRNALLQQPVTDVDIATTTLPDETMRRAQAAGFRTVATGYEHGTVTVIAAGRAYEVTTLRADVETDGRRAKVRFGRDWAADAARRDFTINGLYADISGMVIDLVGGLADIESRAIRFIGDAETRIREDYLRILRFFRFFAWYGSGRPDAEGLKACARLRDGLAGLSAERVCAELRKLLAAPDPARALLWMRQAGVLTAILPESEKWGIDAIPALIAAERTEGWPADPLLRLAAMLPPDPQRLAAMAERLKFARAETSRVANWAGASLPGPEADRAALHRAFYRGDTQAIGDRLRIALAVAQDAKAQAGFRRALAALEEWSRPMLPVRGADLQALGMAPGPALGRTLERLEQAWIESGFSLDRAALLRLAADPT